MRLASLGCASHMFMQNISACGLHKEADIKKDKTKNLQKVKFSYFSN